jgi:ATP synthase protein I
LKSPVFFCLKYQALASTLLVVVALVFGKVYVISITLGAAIYILANLYFTLYAFRYRGASATVWIAQSFSWGESGKFALTAVGFALVFRFVEPLHEPTLFAGFSSMIILQWFIGRQLAKAFSEAGIGDNENRN